MVQSLNAKAEYTTQGISYLGIGAKYGKILVGDQAFEFFNDNNVEDRKFYLDLESLKLRKFL